MITEKKKRTDLQSPTFLKNEWEKGTEAREQMAMCLQAVNWDKAGVQALHMYSGFKNLF